VTDDPSTEPSPQQRWAAVDGYIADHLLPADAALDAAVADSAAAGLPPISVTPNQGKLLQMLARIQGARTILELGTLGGYSTIWLARALPTGGHLITLEAEPRYADLARANIATSSSRAYAASTSWPAPRSIRARSPPPRSRPSARRVTTGSRSCSSRARGSLLSIMPETA
jgi:hypothetical protein